MGKFRGLENIRVKDNSMLKCCVSAWNTKPTSAFHSKYKHTLDPRGTIVGTERSEMDSNDLPSYFTHTDTVATTPTLYPHWLGSEGTRLICPVEIAVETRYLLNSIFNVNDFVINLSLPSPEHICHRHECLEEIHVFEVKGDWFLKLKLAGWINPKESYWTFNKYLFVLIF